jgi:glycosyltransferase involved in cell wall biosynthesis
MFIRVANKFLDVLFTLEMHLVLLFLRLFARKRKTGNNGKKSILALPYYSENYAGGHSRIGDWQPFFAEDDIQFDVHWASESKEFLKEYFSENPFIRYFFFHKTLIRRVKILMKAHQYDVVWVQRAVVPFYPYRQACFEELLTKINQHFILDYYDADYASNNILTHDGARLAKKVTVASSYLLDHFSKINQETYYLPFAINYEVYALKTYIPEQNQLIIGWMGSPENFEFVLELEDVLIEIEQKYPQVKFVFICREKVKLRLKRYEFKSWSDANFDYYQVVSSFDIGIAPMLDYSERHLSKTAFKTLEFMSSGIAFVSSPWGTPNHLVENENVLFAVEMENWMLQIAKLIEDFDLRKKLGKAARITMEQHFSYTQVYSSLKKILLD